MWNNNIRRWMMMAGFVFLVGAGTAHARTAISRDHGRELVEVEDVFQTEEGQFAVILKTDRTPVRYLRIWIAQREALAIRLRLERQNPPRPLTLNLTESILKSSRSTLQSVFIDDFQSGIFLGQIRLKQRGREWTLDARPSDAIALAVGQEVPIWVAGKVIEQVGFELDVKPDPRGASKSNPVPVKKEAPFVETL